MNSELKYMNKFTSKHKFIGKRVDKMKKNTLSGKHVVNDGDAMSAYRYYHEMILRAWVIWLTAFTVFVVGLFEFLMH